MPTPTRILIVDDSYLTRTAIRNIVETDPAFEVVAEAQDGVEALDMLEAHNPDLILLDIEMPRMDGIEFMKRVRLTTTAKIIIISSVAQIGSPRALEALRLGASQIVSKPRGVVSTHFEAAAGGEILQAIRQHAASGPRQGMA